ncbi:MAG: hypothetical protein JWQ16_90 [Novosphingobium sp.]|nr:hypothetical protein [Novosphingobium sp.]
MPKLNERERLADLEARQRRAAQEVAQARGALRTKYAAWVLEVAVEQFTERDFRDLLMHGVRVGGPAAIKALKALPDLAASTTVKS